MAERSKMFHAYINPAGEDQALAARMEERYGVDRGQIKKMDNAGAVEAFRHYNSYDKRMADAYRNDYDARRTMEAAESYGDEDATKLVEQGFNDADDVAAAEKYFVQKHEEFGHEGSFNSRDDYANLTRAMVQKDRDKLLENMKPPEAPEPEPEAPVEEPVELSERAQKAFDFSKSGIFRPSAETESEDVFGSGQDVYGSEEVFGTATGEQVDADTLTFSNNDMAYNPTKGESSPEAGAFLANQKEEYKKGMLNAGVTGRGAGSLNF